MNVYLTRGFLWPGEQEHYEWHIVKAEFCCVPPISIDIWLVVLFACLSVLVNVAELKTIDWNLSFVILALAWLLGITHICVVWESEMCVDRICRIWCFCSFCDLLTSFQLLWLCQSLSFCFSKRVRLQVFCLGFIYPNQLGPAFWL